jgi:diguanylate cyclase (GGDEF)-like protein
MSALSTILVCDDDPGNLIILRKILTDAGYAVITAASGHEALALVDKEAPELFLLDVQMPDLDGLALCRRLKSDPRHAGVPLIFITSKDRTDDLIEGFDAGAADYIAKPVVRAELLARVRTHIKLYRSMLELEQLRQLALESNPLTGLPGNNSLTAAISQDIRSDDPRFVVYCDLDNFKAFNDKYGFASGDDAIVFTARLIERAAARCCGPGQHVWHIGGDDFALLIPARHVAQVTDEIVRRFDRGVRALYDEPARTAGFIESRNRRQQRERFPLMSISIGCVDLASGAFDHHIQVANACAEVKKAAKRIPGSNVFFDRRRG